MSKVADIVELQEERTRRNAGGGGDFDSAGAMLAAARQAADLSLEEVSEKTNIRVPYIEAIEAMAIDRLPIAAYATGFVKAYATLLDLPVDPLVTRFRREAGYETRKTAPEVEMAPKRDLAGGRELSLLAVLLIVGFLLWVVFQITRQPAPQGPVDLPRTPLTERPLTTTPRAEETVTVDIAPADASVPAEVAPVDPGTEGAQSGETPVIETTASQTTITEADATVDDAPARDEAALADPERSSSAVQPPDETQGDGVPVAETPLTPEEPEEMSAAADPAPDLPEPAILPEGGEAATGDGEAGMPAPLQTDPLAIESVDLTGPVTTPQADAETADEPVALALPRTEARTIDRVAPVYPRRCERRAADEEVIVVGYDVSAAGRPVNQRILSSSNACFNDATLTAFRRWSFEPARRGSEAEASYNLTTTFRFQRPE